MNEPPLRIAVSIKDRGTRQTVCTAFAAAGASVQVCDDATLREAGEEVQGIVLGLSAAAEDVLDTLLIVRKRSATIPIYVIADAAGQRHAKRVKSFGATEVIALDLVQRRAPHLVKQVAQAGKGEDWTLQPGWAAAKADQGYDLQSMDLGAWLSVPGNRGLLGMPEPTVAAAAAPTSGPAHQGQRQGGAPRPAVPAESQAAPATVPARDGARLPPSPTPRADSATDGEELAPCSHDDDARLVQCREQHAAQHAAILEVHKQREKRLQADLTNELHQAMAQQLAAAMANAQDRMDAGVAALRLELAAALRRVKLLVGVLFGALFGILVVLGLGLAWRLGAW